MERRDFFKRFLTLSAGYLLLGKMAWQNVFASTTRHLDDNKGKKMKIVVLTGSPRENGNSAHLATQFIKGAEESGHEIVRFDSALKKVEHCTGCLACNYKNPCYLKDDFESLRPHLIAADMIVFSTPIYYHGISSPLKKVIERFNALNSFIKDKNKKSAFMVTFANSDPKTADAILHHYRSLCGYLGFEDIGTVSAPGVYRDGDVKNTSYAEEAYLLGKSI